jgi:hypothetical protein
MFMEMCTNNSLFSSSFSPSMRILSSILATVLVMFAASRMNAQTEQGRWMAGGGFGGNYLAQTQDGQQTTFISYSLNLSPQIGFFIAENFVLGGTANLLGGRSGTAFGSGSVEWFSDSFGGGLGVFGRYFFWEIAPQVKAFGQIATRYQGVTSNYNINDPNTPRRLTAINVSLVPSLGVAWFVVRNVSIETSLLYERRWSVTTNNVSPSQRNTVGNLNLGIGFQIYF